MTNNLPVPYKSNLSNLFVITDSNIRKFNDPEARLELLDSSKEYIYGLKDKLLNKFIISKQAEYHNNLNFFRKYIFSNKAEDEKFIKNLRFKSEIIDLSLIIAIEALSEITNNFPFLYNYYIIIPQMIKSLINNILFFNKNNWVNLKKGIPEKNYWYLCSLLKRYNYSNPNKTIIKCINQFYKNQDVIIPPNDFLIVNDKNYESSSLYFLTLLKQCEATELADQNSQTYKSLIDFGKNICGFNNDEINFLISKALSDNTVMSLVIDIPLFCITDFLDDVIKKVANTEDRISFLIDNDPFKHKRDFNKNMLKRGLTAASFFAISSLSGNTYDFLSLLALPILIKTFEDPNHPEINQLITNKFYANLKEKRKKLNTQ